MTYFYRAFYLTGILFLMCFQNLRAQENNSNPNKLETIPEPELIESYNSFKADEASMIIDALRRRVAETPNGRGYIIIYCGNICRYGEIEAHLRGINLALRFKGVSFKQYKVIAGGYKEKTTAEFWLVPAGACPPKLDSEIDFKDVKFKGLFKRTVVDYECCFLDT